MKDWPAYRKKAIEAIWGQSPPNNVQAKSPISLARMLGLVRGKVFRNQAKKLIREWALTGVKPTVPMVVIHTALKTNFYESMGWRAVRYKALVLHGGRCQCCGAGREQGKIMHVDHIKPKSLYPELALVLDNLQVLCEDCNLGKSNRDETDWRPRLALVRP